ncbi:hypothetical protein SDJN03_11005, partial [Cucurbita argyrosperma subsp. sororia]
MGRHESFEATEELAADKDSGNGVGLVREEVVENGLDVVGDGGMGEVIELDDCGADTEAEEEALDDGAHTAAADAENNDGIAAGQVADKVVRLP